MLEHIIFDYDGVLVNSFEFHLGMYNDIFDIGLTEEELRDAHNGNFYEAKTDKWERVDIQTYARTVAPHQQKLPLNPGVKESLETFSKDKTLHLVTSGWQEQILPNLQYHGIDAYFAHMLFADHGLSKHEKIERILGDENADADTAIFITDTVGDLHEAKQVPIRAIAVTFGFHPEETLRSGNPDHLVHSWAELHKLLDSL